ncbi:Hypoxia up-regulated protein 1 [Durusdinium trenchii]|uniref:Hypoxia up-regulated protein 1 n=1 Tax=Durusdinium trenchii TaxID=1381693 RepID=A0ABP0PWD4_9DINO
MEIVLNSHSKRKTTTAVSYFEASRVFGDDALAHISKAPTKVPTFFHSLLGQNFTSEADLEVGGAWWQKFGLSDLFYKFDLGYDAERGVPTFKIAETEAQGEEVLASILSFAKQMSEDSADGKSVRELVVTVPSDATLRQRQAIISAGEIAGCRVLTLVHETSAFAVQRATDDDVTPAKGASDIHLFYNLGSRKAEVSIVRFESRPAGMVANKMVPVLTVLGSAIDYSIGGHLMDIRIAEAMLKKFQEKFPKLKDGVAKNPRALRKVLSQAQKTKAVLSSNKVAPFNVESLYEDTDFQATLSRGDFEAMCQDMFDTLSRPIEKALNAANITMSDVKFVEVVGGAWRVPKVQQLLSSYLKSGDSSLPLGQHLNGEEAGALGAALVGANSSSSFRVKKIFFTDLSAHEYAVQVTALDGSWEKNYTVLYPMGSALGAKKKLSFSTEEDFKVKLFEERVLLQLNRAVLGGEKP